MDSAKKMSLKACKSTVSERENGVEDSTNAPLNEKDEEKRGKLRDCSASKERDLFDIVSFQQENFVQSRNPSPNTHYDTVLWLALAYFIIPFKCFFTSKEVMKMGKSSGYGLYEANYLNFFFPHF